MIRLNNYSNDPAFNLALEEYLLKSDPREYFMLWRDRPSVICGRNQNIFQETDLVIAEQCGITVMKRFTGGGAVYHDGGCVNYTMIINDPDGCMTYEQLTRPIIEALRSMGAAAESAPSGAITVCGRKVSGGAEARHRGRVLHHGTLLHSTELDALERYAGRRTLQNTRRTIESRAVKSSVAGVMNLSECIGAASPDEFSSELVSRLTSLIDGVRELTNDECTAAAELARSKYSTWEWNAGTSPRFTFSGTYRGNRFSYSSYHGVIEEASSEISELVGCRLERAALVSALAEQDDAEELSKFLISGRDPE